MAEGLEKALAFKAQRTRKRYPGDLFEGILTKVSTLIAGTGLLEMTSKFVVLVSIAKDSTPRQSATERLWISGGTVEIEKRRTQKATHGFCLEGCLK